MHNQNNVSVALAACGDACVAGCGATCGATFCVSGIVAGVHVHTNLCKSMMLDLLGKVETCG